MAGNPWDTRAFEQLSRQYWQAWGDMLRAAPAAPRTDPWTEAMAGWTQVAGAGAPDAADTLQRFGRQAQAWWGQMQSLAAQLASGESTAAQVAQAWRAGFDRLGGNPFADLLGAMPGPGASGFGDWQQAAAPWMRLFGSDGREALQWPAFGFAREHQERWQALAAAQLEVQDATQRYNALLLQASREAFSKFESRLAAHEAPGRQLTSARALYDAWVDAAEEAWAELALSPEYRHAFAVQANAQMRLRAAFQQQLEEWCDALGLPSRTEVDSAHRKLAELERALRRQRAAAGARDGETAPSRASVAAAAAGRKPVARRKATPVASKPAAPAKVVKAAKTAKTKTAKTAKAAKAGKRTPAKVGRAPSPGAKAPAIPMPSAIQPMAARKRARR